MRFLHLTMLLYCFLNVFSLDPALESPAKILKSIPPQGYREATGTNLTTTNDGEPGATNIIFQSNDGGQTWQDISQGLPENESPEGFFAGESDVYLYVNKIMYRSKSNLETPVWEKENALDPRSTSIAFNRSGVMAYNYDGQIYQRMPSAGRDSPDSYRDRDWLPVYTNFQKHLMRTIFETSDGTIFLGSDHGLYKSADRGQNWKQVQNEGWVMEMVESEGVLIATGEKGIMRSTDNGEYWQWVISEGGVGIAVERIEGGFAAIFYSSATLSRRMSISWDGGKTWKAIDEGLRPSLTLSSIKQMGKYLICGHPDGIFRSGDMGKTWNIVHSIVEKRVVKYGKSWNVVDFSADNKVFTIYLSGNTLYGVATDTGC
jgi:photosystem II stability/assembly factor-like uncharacterized protein